MKIVLCPCGNKVQTKRPQRTKYCSKVCFYKYRTRPKGLNYVIRQVNKSWFKKGQKPWCTGTKGVLRAWNKGIKGTHFSPATEFKKGQKPSLKAIQKAKERLGELHPNWKGDEVGYHALHSWVKRKWGKPTQCENCENTQQSKRLEWANLSGKYKRVQNDWIQLCAKCHRRYDRGLINLCV